MSTFNLATATYAELQDAQEVYQEQYGDIVSQYKSEIAGYGDAWAGSAKEVAEALAILTAVNSALASYEAL